MAVINKEIDELRRLCDQIDETNDQVLKRKLSPELSPSPSPDPKRRRRTSQDSAADNDAVDLSFSAEPSPERSDEVVAEKNI